MKPTLLQGTLQVASAAVFAALLLALPIALLMVVGWPGPTATPEIDAARSVLSGQQKVPELFVIKSIAVVGWIIWFQLFYAAWAEVRAARLGLLARRTTFIPGLQRFAAASVLAITLLVNGLKPSGAAAAILEPVSSQPHEVGPFTSQPTELPEVSKSTAPSYITKPGDSWWGLAKTHLGDGSRFSEIRDLNIGTRFDGVTVTGSSDYLGAGWKLKMPSDTNIKDIATVRSGDTVSRIAAKHDVSVAELVTLNKLAEPDLIHPGDKLRLPSHTSPVSPPEPPPQNRATPQGPPAPATPSRGTVPKPSSQQTAPPTPGSAPASVEVSSDLGPPEIVDEENPAPLNARSTIGGLLVGAGLLGSCLYGVRRRRLQAVLREFDVETNDCQPHIVQATTEHPTTEHRVAGQLVNRIAAAASYQDAELLEVLLQLVGQRMGQASADPGIVAAILGGTAAEIIFAAQPSFEPGPMFHKTARPGWRAERPDSLDSLRRLASFSPVPSPAMVSLGSIETASLLAINLEEVGGLNLVGDDTNIRSMMFSLVVELATTRLADTMKIVAIGFDSPLPELDRIEQYDSVPEHLQPGFFVADPAMQRLLDVDPIEPIIAISPDPTVAKRLALPGVIPITANAPDLGLWDLLVEEYTLSCPKLGLANIERAAIGNDDVRKYLTPLPSANLPTIEIAARTTGPVGNSLLKSVQLSGGNEVPRVPLKTELQGDAAPQVAKMRLTSLDVKPVEPFSPVVPADMGFDYIVSVLGPIRCDGVGLADPDKPWKLRKVPELLSLLATSERGRTSDALKELLWPGADPATCGRRLNNVVSELRRSVVGEERLPKVTPGTSLYRLERVGTDLALFEENLRRSKAALSEQLRMEYLGAALALVKGAPFDLTGTTSGEYGWAESVEYAATVQIVSAAQSLTRWQLEADRPTEAAEAAEVGLLVSADNYTLLRLYGLASLAEADGARSLKALMAIHETQHQFEALPGETEVVLPEDLLETEAALQRRVNSRSA